MVVTLAHPEGHELPVFHSNSFKQKRGKKKKQTSKTQSIFANITKPSWKATSPFLFVPKKMLKSELPATIFRFSLREITRKGRKAPQFGATINHSKSPNIEPTTSEHQFQPSMDSFFWGAIFFQDNKATLPQPWKKFNLLTAAVSVAQDLPMDGILLKESTRNRKKKINSHGYLLRYQKTGPKSCFM